MIGNPSNRTIKNAKKALESLDLNYEGSTPIVESVAAGQSFYEPAAPTREGYEFAGWYKDAACTDGQEADLSVAGTYYAKWVENAHDAFAYVFASEVFTFSLMAGLLVAAIVLSLLVRLPPELKEGHTRLKAEHKVP